MLNLGFVQRFSNWVILPPWGRWREREILALFLYSCIGRLFTKMALLINSYIITAVGLLILKIDRLYLLLDHATRSNRFLVFLFILCFILQAIYSILINKMAVLINRLSIKTQVCFNMSFKFSAWRSAFRNTFIVSNVYDHSTANVG